MAYTASLVDNYVFNTDKIRYNFTSLTVPTSIFEYNLKTKNSILLKEQEIVGGYDKDAYISKRLEIKATDGTLVPVSLVYKKIERKILAIPYFYMLMDPTVLVLTHLFHLSGYHCWTEAMYMQ